jgi:putative ABC transport system ATP-binding protein
MLRINNLYFKYPKSDFQLQIEDLLFKKGETHALIGPSGSGKTTLLNLIAGISTPHKGIIKYKEIEINKLRETERRAYRISKIGFVFQDFKLINYLSVSENIMLPYRINTRLKIDPQTRARVDTLSEYAGIAKYLSKYPKNLSQGERQRVAICRALVTQPELILADEPTGNLDPKNKKKILDLLFKYCREEGTTLITVTHDHELLPDFDEVIDFSNLLTEDEIYVKSNKTNTEK